MTTFGIFAFVCVIAFVIGFCRFIFLAKHQGYLQIPDPDIRSIGIYEGRSPLTLAPAKDVNNPVLTGEDVSDRRAYNVAYPFLVQEPGIWHMFFEVMDTRTKRGCIGWATSQDYKNWKYQKVILEEPLHLSYPQVFKWQNDYYMIPESDAFRQIKLYKATRFPDEWTYVKTLIDGEEYTVPNVFYFKDKWWIWSSNTAHDRTALFYSDDLFGPWIPHAKNPMFKNDPEKARFGGRIFQFEGKIYRLAQSAVLYYGAAANLYEIKILSTTHYEETKVGSEPFLCSFGYGWNKDGIHHADVYRQSEGNWIVCVDGERRISLTKRRLLWAVYFFNAQRLLNEIRIISGLLRTFIALPERFKREWQRLTQGKMTLEAPDRPILEQIIIPYLVNVKEASRFLFVGCDWYTQHYATFFTGKEYWTIDRDSNKKKYGSQKHIVDSIENLGKYFSENYFDAIICTGVFGFGLNLKESVEEAFEHCYRSLKPSGIFVFGWDDIPARKPFDPATLNSLKKFQSFSFDPLGTSHFKVPQSDLQHTFDFFMKPQRVDSLKPQNELESKGVEIGNR